MKLSIRLQSKGIRNHPYWWIVVAPNRKNNFGRFTQHVGYWTPRKGILAQRQIVLNLVRIKYWISCGAVPTPKIQKFLSYYDVMPSPWYYKKSQAQLQKQKAGKQGQQLTQKQKRKEQWKQQRRAKQKLDVNSRYAAFRGRSKLEQQIYNHYVMQKQENEYLRSLIIQKEFENYARVKQLAAKKIQANLYELRDKIQKLKQQYLLLQQNTQNMHPVKQALIIEKINQLYPKLVQLQIKQNQKSKINQAEQSDLQNIVLKRTIKHQLFAKKLENFQKQLTTYLKQLQPLTETSYAEFLVEKHKMIRRQADIIAKQIFHVFAQKGQIPRVGDISQKTVLNPQFARPHNYKSLKIPKQMKIDKQIPEGAKKLQQMHVDNNRDGYDLGKKYGKFIVHLQQPIHPFPDLITYYPQQYYEIPKRHDFGLQNAPQYFPEQELDKYRRKLSKLKTFKN